jgi:flagellar protein FliS
MNKNPFKAYQKTQVTTARKDQVLLMLYEGCIRYMKHAKQKMIEKKIAEKGKFISKSIDILSELMNTLDHKAGGQLSGDLESLYMFMIDRLIEANLHNRPEDIDIVIDLMSNLYVAWDDVINNPRPDGVPSPNLQPELYEQWLESQGGGVPAKNQSKAG